MSGTFGYSKVYLMQFHYDYPHYYLPLERNHDVGRVGGKRLPLEPIVGLPLEPMVVLPQEQTELLPQDIPITRRKVNVLVAP